MMEGNYPPGFYGIEREQQDSRHQSSQQQQQSRQQTQEHHQQHPAHYPLDLPIPYFTPGQHHPGYVEDQPTRGFSGSHPGSGVPAPSMLRSLYHDPSAVHLAANLMHEAHQQRHSNHGGHESVRQTHPMPAHDPPITTLQNTVDRRHASSSTTREQIRENENESAVDDNVALTSTSAPVSTTEDSEEFAKVPETDVESDTRLNTSGEPPAADDAEEQEGDLDSEPGPSEEMQTDPTSPHQPEPEASLASPEPPANKPQLFAALNLKKSSSYLDLPSNLKLKMAPKSKIEGVVAKKLIEAGVEFGPYTGELLDEEKGRTKESTWEICISGKVLFYIDGHKTWMSHIQCAKSEDEQNMEVYQHCGDIRFRTTTVVEPGCELRAFYNKEYGKCVGIKTDLNDLRFNESKRKFQCERCGDLFRSAKLLVRHTKCEHTNFKASEKFPVVTWRKRKKPEPLKIKISTRQPRETKTKKKVVRKSVESHTCGICKKTFTSVGRLKAHKIFHEDDDGAAAEDVVPTPKAPPKRRKKPEEKNFECKECGEVYAMRSSLTRHDRTVHGYPCRFCKERFHDKEEWAKHEQTHQAYKEQKPRKRKPRKESADTIQPSTPAPEELQDMLGRTAEFSQRMFKCRFCPKRYSNRSTAAHHELEVHTGEGKFKCQHCSKAFSSEYRYKDHLAVHQYVNMYRCTLCPRSFASESALNNHQGEHTGLKPFKCDVCGRGFRTRKLALKHKGRIHRDRPKRFQCSICTKAFAEKSDLKVHERRHKGIRQYVCLECGRGFTSSSSLQAHMLGKHSKEKPFVCQLCGKSFALNHQFNRHIAKHRAEGETNIDNIYSSIPPPEEPPTQPQQQQQPQQPVASKHQSAASTHRPVASNHQSVASMQHPHTSATQHHHQPMTSEPQHHQPLSSASQHHQPLMSAAHHHQLTTIQLQHLIIPHQQLTTPPPQKLV